MTSPIITGAPGCTPGPWEACLCGCGFVGGDDDMVATVTEGKWGDWGTDLLSAECSLVHHWGTVSPERARANANLIAATPDLLDALENLVIGIGMGWDLDGLIEVSNAALAKARGEA